MKTKIKSHLAKTFLIVAPRHVKRIGLWGTLLCAMSPAFACLNDRDTLAEEAAAIQANETGLPHVVRVITGRFERNPPRYYEMRLARVSQEIAAAPTKLELYDDAAVAADRLHRSKEALIWIEKKRQQLESSQLDAATKREQWYRYYANAGTFHAHQWLRSGANRKEMRELKQGRDLIKRAIAIKPNAHFGREKYQLKFMEWVLNPPKNQEEARAQDFLGLEPFNGHMQSNRLKSSPYPDAITGLSGLIVLGDAWRSVDIYYALAQALGAQGDNTISDLTAERCREIFDSGGKSLSLDKGQELKDTLDVPMYTVKAGIEDKYRELRADAEAYQKTRLHYMNTKFDKGQHPDTNSDFWNEWQEPPMPSLTMPGDPVPPLISKNMQDVLILLGSVMLLAIGVISLRRHAAKRDAHALV